MTFARLFSEATVGELPRSGDVLAVGLPLLRRMDELHRQDLVSGAWGVHALDYDGERLTVTVNQPADEASNWPAVDRIAAAAHRSAIEVGARRRHDLAADGPLGRRTSDDVIDPDDGRPERPVFVRGYRVWEQLHGHHDPLTDVALAGLWLCSYAFGLDLDAPEGIDTLAQHYRRPSVLNPSLHPVLAGTLTDMIEPDRSRRPSELSQVIARLENYRDIPADLDLGAAYLPDTDWRRAVLTTLRDRVFDTTRRNRELYFRRTATSVSLTEASVPLMLNIDRIRPRDLLTWTGPAATKVRKGEVDLGSWCRFEEAPYLAPALDKMISADRRTKVETGHSRLRLILAFLRWYDTDAKESVTSPLLTVPATLTRKKGVETRYRLDAGHDIATVNPVLRHVFAKRFDIELPEEVESDERGIAAFVEDLERRVQATSPAVTVELIDKPRVDLLRRRAQLRVDSYRRNRARTLASSGRWRRQEFSYDPGDWRPLGHALYERFVRPADLPLRDLAGAPPRPRSQAFGESDDAPGTRTSETYSLGGNDAAADRWHVDLCSVTLAMLGSRRTSLARDYDAVLSEGAIDVRETPFEPLFRPDQLMARPAPTESIDPRQMLVLPADDAQARAVQRATRGDSFIIQGPPGTGKSQTIANVIAALVADGKRVLFVCEKRAAIDVVAHRLHQVGLGDLTALIHDAQLDKKQFVADLGATYHRWSEAIDPAAVASGSEGSAERRRGDLLEEIDRALRPIRDLTGELGRPLGAGVSIADAIDRLARLEALSDATKESDAAAIEVATDEWLRLRPRLDRVHEALAGAGMAGSLGSVPALRVAPAALDGRDVIDVARRLADVLDGVGPDVDDDRSLAEVDEAIGWLPTIEAVAGAGALPSLDPSSPRHLDLRAAAQQQIELRQAATLAEAVLERWTAPLSPEDTTAALAVAEAKESSMLRFLSGRWRQVRSLVEDAYRFDTHEVRPTTTAVLSELADYHAAVGEAQAAEHRTATGYGLSDAVMLRDLVDHANGRPAFTTLIGSGADLGRIAGQFRDVADVAGQAVLAPDATVGDLRRLGPALAGTPVGLEPVLVAWSGLGDVATETLATVLDADGSLDQIEARVLRGALDRWAATVDHQRFTGARIDEAVATVGSHYRELLDANAAVTVERAHATFADNIVHSEASMAGRSPEDKARKKAYKAGRRVVEREAEKKTRHRSIREMASGESQVVVRDLRPVWLMSPLSVSDTLPLEAGLFDVVVFDEASQIPVEDAIPSVVRAPQVIVVGDRMQMPPTRFFSSDDDEGEVLVDEDGHPRSIMLDSDSFLTQAETALSSSMLNWHYRSRSESLIAYSNHAFYGGRLATVPDTALPTGSHGELVADDTGDAVEHTAEALRRPISFHFLEHGRYRDRRNAAEADYIAEMVREVLRGDTGLTIGVVAFSEAQQGAIETALDDLAAIDADFAERYETELQRTDEGEHVGLFVKNLENVQGDERDLIIMSVCYGPDDRGRVRMNFGPINNAGGERRLNVIFSRAKQHMAVVASMRGSAVTNLHNEGASHLAGFLTYAEAESRGETGMSTAQLRTLTLGATEPEAVSGAVASHLAEELRARGWDADLAVGRSAFRIDVAIAIDGAYRVGVLLEPDREPDGHPAPRYVAEAGVLRAFGWPVVRVPLSDWFADPGRVVDRIEVLARAAAAPSA